MTPKQWLKNIGAPARGAFKWDDAEPEWSPYWCDDCNAWHKSGRTVEVERRDDNSIEVTIGSVDEDGNWDVETSYDSRTDSLQDWAYVLDTLQDSESARRAWDEYARWVIEHGEDPLSEYFVRRDREVRERWTFWLRQGIGHVRCHRVKHGGKVWSPSEFASLPQHVRDYLHLDGDAVVTGVESVASLYETRSQYRKARMLNTRKVAPDEILIEDVLTHKVRRPAGAYVRELRRVARRGLKLRSAA